MEMTSKMRLKKRFMGIFLKDKSHFMDRREIKWQSIQRLAILAIGTGIFVILIVPSSSSDSAIFHQQSESAESSSLTPPSDPTQEALSQLVSVGRTQIPHVSINDLYSKSNSGAERTKADINASMIISREGTDSKTYIPSGSHLSVRLFESAITTNHGKPVIGLVSRDFIQEDNIAIPVGSKLFGEISFDVENGRAKIEWHSIQMPDGRERPFSAISVGSDGQMGVEGEVHSEAIKNTVGQALTRFIAAYAEGSIQHGIMGASMGGHSNGLKHAVSETAMERAEAWAEEMKKEKQWIEVSNKIDFFAVLTQKFAFRDPGAIYAK